MIAIVLQISLYLLAGFVEMFLASRRTYFISQNKTGLAAGIVFFENILAFFIIYQLVTNLQKNIPSFFAYAVGGSLGTLLKIERG